jgi:prevent-host-death family protein
MNIPIAEGKAQFAELVRKAEAGEVITITRHGRVVAQLIGAAPAPSRPLIGALKGQITLAEDFDDLPRGFATALAAPIDPSP